MPDSNPLESATTPPQEVLVNKDHTSSPVQSAEAVYRPTGAANGKGFPGLGSPSPQMAFSFAHQSPEVLSPTNGLVTAPPDSGKDDYMLPSLSVSIKSLERAIASEELRVVVDVVKNDRSTVTAWFTFFSLVPNENLASFRQRFDEAVLRKTLHRQGVDDYAFYCEMKSRSGDLFPIDGDLQWTAVKPKLALHPDRYRLYVHVSQNVVEGKRETRVLVVPTTDEQAVDALGQETVFLFSSGGVSECKNVFYVPNPISSGCLYHCTTDRKVQYFSCRLPLDEISSFYLTGASSVDYKHSAPIEEVPEKDKRSMNLLSDLFGGEDTLVILTPHQQWKLQISSGLCTWVAGLHYALVSTGAQITHERQRDRLHFNVERAMSSALSISTPENVEDMMTMASRPTFYDYYRDMAQGRNFAIFSLDSQGEVRKDDVFLFFDDQEPVPFQTMGALYWCEPGRRVAFSSHCMPIRNIREIYTGKRTQIFECKAGVPSRKECCLTLISDRERLDLEAESPRVVHNWVRAINTLKQKAGTKVCSDEVVPRENNVPSSRKFDTIMPKNLPIDFSMFNAQERVKMKEVNRLLQLAEEPVKGIHELKSDVTALRERLVVLELKLAHAQVEKEMRRTAHKQRTRERRSTPLQQTQHQQPRAVFNPRAAATIDDDVAALQRMEQLLDSLEADGEPDDGNFSPEPYVPTPSNPIGRLHYMSPSQTSEFRTPNDSMNPVSMHVSPIPLVPPGASSDSAGDDPPPLSHFHMGEYATEIEKRADRLHSEVQGINDNSDAYHSTAPSLTVDATFSPIPLVSPFPDLEEEARVVNDVRKTRARVEKKVQDQRSKRSLLHSHRANSISD